MEQDQNRFINIESAKNVAVIILCFSLVAVICVTSIMMSSSYIKLPTSVLAQGKQNFTANLIGQDEVPPTNSKATGNSTLILSSDGMNIKYEVNVKDIDNVIAAQIQQGKKGESGPVIVTLIRFKALTPTGPVDGLLAEGNITADKLQGPLKGKQISDLTTLIDDNNAYVNVLTQQNPEGEIRGQIFD
ncbi:MAG: CHRD domain-containing protein [Nitrososphaeraceae archaeon]